SLQLGARRTLWADRLAQEGAPLILHFRFTLKKRTRCCTAVDGESGRVEDGRGSLGPLASAPFPIPAHRTGRAELPHPALRLASPQGPQRGRSGQAFKAQHAAVPMDLIVCEPTVAAPCHLVPSGEKAAHALTNVVINTAERCHRRPQVEVAR